MYKVHNSEKRSGGINWNELYKTPAFWGVVIAVIFATAHYGLGMTHSQPH